MQKVFTCILQYFEASDKSIRFRVFLYLKKCQKGAIPVVDNLAAFRCSFLKYLRNSLYWSFSHVRSQTANARLTPSLNACLFLTNENVNRSLLLSLTKCVDPNIKKNLMYFNLFHQPPLLQAIYTVIDVDFLFLRFI